MLRLLTLILFGLSLSLTAPALPARADGPQRFTDLDPDDTLLIASALKQYVFGCVPRKDLMFMMVCPRQAQKDSYVYNNMAFVPAELTVSYRVEPPQAVQAKNAAAEALGLRFCREIRYFRNGRDEEGDEVRCVVGGEIRIYVVRIRYLGEEV